MFAVLRLVHVCSHVHSTRSPTKRSVAAVASLPQELVLDSDEGAWSRRSAPEAANARAVSALQRSLGGALVWLKLVWVVVAACRVESTRVRATFGLEAPNTHFVTGFESAACPGVC